MILVDLHHVHLMYWFTNWCCKLLISSMVWRCIMCVNHYINHVPLQLICLSLLKTLYMIVYQIWSPQTHSGFSLPLLSYYKCCAFIWIKHCHNISNTFVIIDTDLFRYILMLCPFHHEINGHLPNNRLILLFITEDIRSIQCIWIIQWLIMYFIFLLFFLCVIWILFVV